MLIVLCIFTFNLCCLLTATFEQREAVARGSRKPLWENTIDQRVGKPHPLLQTLGLCSDASNRFPRT